MRICIYGAGAVGGYLGVQLALAGVDVSLIARGSHLSAMQQNGVKLLIGDEERVAYPRCTFDPTELGVQDVVIVCLKAPAWPKIVDSIQPLLGADTAVVTAVNGIPGGIFTNSTVPGATISFKALIRVVSSGKRLARNVPLAVSSIQRQKLLCQV